MEKSIFTFFRRKFWFRMAMEKRKINKLVNQSATMPEDFIIGKILSLRVIHTIHPTFVLKSHH